MDLTTITAQDFKDLFYRDFPYLNIWNVLSTYNTGALVYYAVNALFYTCLNNGVTSVPTTTADWSLTTDNTFNYVLDADIEKAFAEAMINFNQALFSTAAEIQLAFLYLSAHFLVTDIRRSSQGLNSRGDYIAQSQSVGNVSEALAIPDSINNNPQFSLYTTSGYGIKYLNLVMPRLVGHVGVVQGATNA